MNKERQEGKCDRLGNCGMENSSWQGTGGESRTREEAGREKERGKRETEAREKGKVGAKGAKGRAPIPHKFHRTSLVKDVLKYF